MQENYFFHIRLVQFLIDMTKNYKIDSWSCWKNIDLNYTEDIDAECWGKEDSMQKSFKFANLKWWSNH